MIQTSVPTEVDRAQLLIETLKAAQAAHAKKLESGELNSDDEEADAVVNPQEPQEIKDEKSDADSVEIIHMNEDGDNV